MRNALIIAFILVINSFSWAANTKQCLYNYFSPRQIISYEKLQDLVDFHNEWYDVVIPTERGFEYKQAQSWLEVERSLDKLEPQQKDFVTDLLWQAHGRHSDVIDHFKPLAIENRAEFRTRIKDIASLRRKIIDRAKSYQNRDQIFSPQNLNDIIGIRFTLPEGAELLNFKGDVDFFAKRLNLDPKQILEVEIKGGVEEQQKGRFYRAIHLAVQIDTNTRVELQLMSKAMYLWHSWDHPIVYKSKITDDLYKDKLKRYSQTWVRIIRLAEDVLSGEKKDDQLRELLIQNQIDPKVSRQILPQVIDSRLSSVMGIHYEDRIIMEKYKGELNARKDFFRVVGKLFQEISF